MATATANPSISQWAPRLAGPHACVSGLRHTDSCRERSAASPIGGCRYGHEFPVGGIAYPRYQPHCSGDRCDPAIDTWCCKQQGPLRLAYLVYNRPGCRTCMASAQLVACTGRAIQLRGSATAGRASENQRCSRCPDAALRTSTEQPRA
jgi:hypothetical protein